MREPYTERELRFLDEFANWNARSGAKCPPLPKGYSWAKFLVDGVWPLTPNLLAFLTDLPIKNDVIVTSKGRAHLVLELFDGYAIVKRVMAMDRGASHAAMKLICAAADRHNVTLRLCAEPLMVSPYNLTRKRLEQWYAGFGFEQRNYRGGKCPIQMERKPHRPNPRPAGAAPDRAQATEAPQAAPPSPRREP
jgi:hypothetical protein